MDFEFDEVKSAANKEKHGIDFLQAQLLWEDARALMVQANSVDEPRFAIIAELQGKTWTCIFTHRENRIRIISTRRARHGEEQKYHQG